MKTKLATILIVISGCTIFAGSDKVVMAPAPSPPPIYYRAGEFNVSASFNGLFTQTPYLSDRYYGVDHAWGGSLGAAYFFTKYIGAGLNFDGYRVTSTGTGFIGDLVPRLILRYPIGQFAPYGFVGAGMIFNGGNPSLSEPSCTVGCTLRFERVEHDVKLDAQAGAGIEFRLTRNWGIFAEGQFEKIDRPQSNAYSFKSGVRFAF